MTGLYRIEWNAKISKWQIKIPGFNVAIAEFYDNSASSREDIQAIFNAAAERQKPQAEESTIVT